MGKIIRLTEDWVFFAPAPTYTQPTYAAIDVAEFDLLDLMVSVGATSSVSFTLNVSLESSMTLYSESAWVPVLIAGSAAVATLTGRNASAGTTVSIPTIAGGFYRYIRWTATVATGTVSKAAVLVEGIGRSYSAGG